MSHANVDVIQRLYAAFWNRDMDAMLALLSPDIEVHQSSELPWGGEYKGHEGFKKFIKQLTGHITPSLSFERFIDSGDHVVAIGRTHGDVVHNGKPFDVPVVHVWEVRDGKVMRFHPHIDNAVMLTAIRGRAVC